MAWLILLAMFLVTAFMTYGLFANISYERRRKEKAEHDEELRAMGDGTLSSKLAVDLKGQAVAGKSAEQPLSRVPYGYCTSTDDCDKTKRCVQCNFYGTTEEDVHALEGLLEQEVSQAERAERQGLVREAEIHRAIAASVESHLRSFSKETVRK